MVISLAAISVNSPSPWFWVGARHPARSQVVIGPLYTARCVWTAQKVDLSERETPNGIVYNLDEDDPEPIFVKKISVGDVTAIP
jgi:hypothetical protein